MADIIGSRSPASFRGWARALVTTLAVILQAIEHAERVDKNMRLAAAALPLALVISAGGLASHATAQEAGKPPNPEDLLGNIVVLAEGAQRPLPKIGVLPSLASDSEEAMAAAEAHRRHISRWFYECDYEIHRGLTEMYISDERFRSNYDAQVPGLAAFIRDAAHANADQHFS